MSTINRVRYIRDSYGNKFGVMEVLYENGKFGVGISLCNTKIDKFEKSEGRDIAHQRATSCREKTPLLLKDLINCNLEDVAGCNLPNVKGNFGDPALVKACNIIRCYELLVEDIIYTLALSKVRAETER